MPLDTFSEGCMRSSFKLSITIFVTIWSTIQSLLIYRTTLVISFFPRYMIPVNQSYTPCTFCHAMKCSQIVLVNFALCDANIWILTPFTLLLDCYLVFFTLYPVTRFWLSFILGKGLPSGSSDVLLVVFMTIAELSLRVFVIASSLPVGNV